MLVVLSDTHSDAGHELVGRAREAVAEADAVVHAGDFTAPAALDAFQEVADALHAVHGNADAAAVRERLPPARTATALGLRIAVTHRREGGDTGLVMFGRERGADLVVSGHTHRPRFEAAETGPALLNPGSHADPRGGPASHAELVRAAGGDSQKRREGANAGAVGERGLPRKSTRVRGRLYRRDGSVLEKFVLAAPAE
jgi:putative phosphoesterase